MPVIDAYGERKAMAARQDTWGHLQPPKGRKLPGYILFATSPYYELGWTVLEDGFAALASNPWYYDELCAYLNDLAAKCDEGRLYLWRGTYEHCDDAVDYPDQQRRFFKGRARRLKIADASLSAARRSIVDKRRRPC